LRFRGLLLHLFTLSDTHTLGKTPLDDGSARRKDHHLTTHDVHKRQISMNPAVFGPANPENERPQKYDLERTASGFGSEAMSQV
jgi:hypothetical protein